MTDVTGVIAPAQVRPDGRADARLPPHQKAPEAGSRPEAPGRGAQARAPAGALADPVATMRTYTPVRSSLPDPQQLPHRLPSATALAPAYTAEGPFNAET